MAALAVGDPLIFSIIIPALNEEKNLERCLESLSKLDFPLSDYEVLLIDNGSVDQTVEIGRQKGARVYERPELTISGLRNLGAMQASGKVLAFLDADCSVASDWLSAASAWTYMEGVACFGGPPGVPEDATWVQKSWFLVRGKKQEVEEVNWLESMNLFIRKDIFVAVGGFDESLQTCEDYDLSLRVKSFGRIIADRRIKAIHHGEAATIGHFYRKESWRGLSNLKGMFRHSLHWQEIPSLLIPIIYFFCFLLTLALVIGLLFRLEGLSLTMVLGWLTLWQMPILLLALIKGEVTSSKIHRFGLYLLLNVYFFARARAMLRVGI